MGEDLMKRIILPLILAFLILLGSARAMSIPVPVSGTITTQGYAGGYEVTITNIRTSDSITVTTNRDGQYLLSSWTNHFDLPLMEDVFKIEVEDVFKNVVYKGGPIEADFELEVTCPKCPPYEDCPVCEECDVCPEDLTPHEECNSCCPMDITPYEKCDSCCPICEECEVCEECPPTNEFFALIIGLISGVVAALVGGEGIKFVIRKNKRTGKLEVQITQHKHKGHGYYHSIYREHKTYWHPKGAVHPVYDKDDKYLGDYK